MTSAALAAVPPGSLPLAERIAHIPMPPGIARLSLHPTMRMPLPWFCMQNPADFRVVRPDVFAKAHKQRLCWVCGGPRYEKRLAFVVGPMCVATGTSAELPAHPACAEYAALACPFLANPRMVRNEKNLPQDASAAGHMIARNPGVCAILTTDRYSLFSDGRGGVLVGMGPAKAVSWWCEGRAATRAEVQRSVDTGVPLLRPQAELDGAEGLAELDRRLAALQALLPAA